MFSNIDQISHGNYGVFRQRVRGWKRRAIGRGCINNQHQVGNTEDKNQYTNKDRSKVICCRCV